MGRTRSRRKVGTLSFHGQNSSTPPESVPSSSGSTNVVTSERRVTAEEAALTAKNYRLAKELNELRCRHREETRNVTKLTMDNMNLATRCREAINHVDLLRKELSLHQKRSSEFLDSGQRKTTFGNPTFNLTLAADEFLDNNDNLFETTFTQQRRPAQDHQIDNLHSETRSNKNNNDNLFKRRTGELFRDVDAKVDDILLNSHTIEQSPALSPSRSSGPDAAFGELQSIEFFQNSYKNTLPTTPESENMKKDDNAFPYDDEKMILNGIEGGSACEGSSNIDAFEASFDTIFPTSFKPTALNHSPPPTETSSRSGVTEDFSDPFFPDAIESRKNGKGRLRRKPGDGEKVVRGKSPPLSSHHQLEPRLGQNSSTTNQKRIDFGRINAKYKSKKDVDLFPESAMKSFEEMSVSTPPAKTKPLDKNGDVFHNPPPPPSEKGGVGAARARYDAAYGESKEDILQSITRGCENSEHNPTLVLKRLQQRKAKEKVSNSPVDLPLNTAKSISEEIRKLDEIAKGSNVSEVPSPPSELLSMSKRRNVRQPISYTEPSLTSKLRQGDVFFPKEDVSTNDATPISDQASQ